MSRCIFTLGRAGHTNEHLVQIQERLTLYCRLLQTSLRVKHITKSIKASNHMDYEFLENIWMCKGSIIYVLRVAT